MIRAQGDVVERPNQLKGSTAKPSPATKKRNGKAPAFVTKVASVTKVSPRQKLADLARVVEQAMGRPKVHASNADRQRAYRARRGKS